MLKLTSSRQEGTGTALLPELPSPHIRALSYIAWETNASWRSMEEGEAMPSFLPAHVSTPSRTLWRRARLSGSRGAQRWTLYSLPPFFFFFFFTLLLEPLTCRHLQLWSRELSHTEWGFSSPPALLSPSGKCRRANSGGNTPENSGGCYKVCLRKTSTTFPLRIALHMEEGEEGRRGEKGKKRC